MRENRTYGSVRGSRQAFHVDKYKKGMSRLSTRRVFAMKHVCRAYCQKIKSPDNSIRVLLRGVVCLLSALILLYVILPGKSIAASDYNTYIFPLTNKHWLANCASGESGASGQQPGDQTGNEYKFSEWGPTLSNGNAWHTVFRYPDIRVGMKIAELGIDAVLNDHIGYDWDYPDRNTYWDQLSIVNFDPSAITTNCEADCSSAVCTNVKAAGYIYGIDALKNVGMANTSTLTTTLTSAGFMALTDSMYCSQKDYLLPGDILLANGHTLINLTKGSQAVLSGSDMGAGYDRVIPNGDYIIMSAASANKAQVFYLDIDGSADPAANATNVILTQCSDDNPPSFDTWTLTYSGGFYTIKQKDTNMCLDVEGISVNSGANVMVGTQNGGSNQKFAIKHEGKNGYIIRAKHSGFAVTLAGNCSSGTNVVQLPVNGSDSQCWLLIPYKPAQPVSEGKYVILDGETGNFELDLPGDTGALDNGANVQLWANSAPSQYNSFILTKYSDGYYKIKHAASGKCLDVSGGLSSSGSNVTVYEDNGSIAQKWAIVSEGEDQYRLVAKCNGYSLDADLASALHNGTNVQTYPMHGGTNQKWSFVQAEHTVHYEANGGEGAPADQTKYYNQNLTLSSAVLTGYYLHEFKGWALSPNAMEPAYLPGEDYVMDEDVTLYAVWEFKKPGVRVACTLNGQPVPEGIAVGTFDIKVLYDGGNETETSCTRYFKELIDGSIYHITNVTSAQGYVFDPGSSGALDGTIGLSVTNVILNFIPKVEINTGLHIQFSVDGEMRETLEGVGDFDVYISDGTNILANETLCTDFNRQFNEECSYEISNITAYYPYRFIGVTSGNVTGMLTNGTVEVVLAFETIFIPQEDWQEMNTLPDNIDLSLCEVEYKNHYEYSGRTSPGDEWTFLREGSVQYESDGDAYKSATQLSESETRKQVDHYYFHYCGDRKDLCNSTNWSNSLNIPLPNYHVRRDFDKVYIYETEYDDGRAAYWLKYTEHPTWDAYCPSYDANGTGSTMWYEEFVYQNYKAYHLNIYAKESDWSTEPDPEATSVTYRIRKKRVTITLDPNGGSFIHDNIEGFAGEDIILYAEKPVRSGYTFLFWTASKEYDEEEEFWQANGNPLVTTEDITLYAQWERKLSLSLPASLLTIEEEAFSNTAATIIYVPASCTTIKKNAFYGNKHLEEIHISASTSSIALDAFDGCPNLTIYAPAGSTAIKVAKYNDIPYVED